MYAEYLSAQHRSACEVSVFLFALALRQLLYVDEKTQCKTRHGLLRTETSAAVCGFWVC